MSLLENNEETRESEEQTDENQRMKDLQTPQRDKRTINPLSLLKVDLSQFKDGVTSIFSISSSKDKETKAEHEDSGQTDSKCVSSTQGLLREDLSQFKDGVTSIFSISSSKDKETKAEHEDSGQTDSKCVSSTQGLLREDLSQFKDGVTSIFSISSSRDKETKAEHEDSGQTDSKCVSSTQGLLREDLSQFKDGVTSIFSISSSRDKETKAEHEDSGQTDSKCVSSTQGLLREDLSQFKDGVTSIFSISSSKDKETKAEHEDSGQTDSKCVSSTQGLLREDLSHLKEEVTSVFSISLSKDKETKSTEKTINLLSLLKEDFNHFKDDISNLFRTGLSKERGTAKEDSSNPFKIKSSTFERTEEPLKSLFRRDQRTSRKAGNSETVKKTFSETSQEQMVGGLRENQREESAEREDSDLKDGVDGPEDSELDVTSYEEKTDKVQAAKQRCEREAWTEDKAINEEEEEPSEKLLWESLSSGISLFNLRDPNKDNRRDRPGDNLWSVKNFACYLTFDPSTANSELHLSDGNRMATRVWSDHRPLDHPDRFKRCPQVLCREGLLDSVYWEVMWSGGADIGVTYNSISRDGAVESCLLGHNEQSWSLECSEGSYTPCHHNKRFRSSSPRPFTRRVGVHLDWAAGSLSFYCVSQDTMVHLHTFTSTFTEPLYPGFWVWAYDGSVSLCQVELDWERLLQ